jgi:hypothetical protein
MKAATSIFEKPAGRISRKLRPTKSARQVNTAVIDQDRRDEIDGEFPVDKGVEHALGAVGYGRLVTEPVEYQMGKPVLVYPAGGMPVPDSIGAEKLRHDGRVTLEVFVRRPGMVRVRTEGFDRVDAVVVEMTSAGKSHPRVAGSDHVSAGVAGEYQYQSVENRLDPR